MQSNNLRNSNIELLRIFAIILIVSCHFTLHGIVSVNSEDSFQVWKNGSIVNRFFSSIFSIGGDLGVGIFFSITGYFGIKMKSLSIRKIIIPTMFYGCFCSLFYFVAVVFPEIFVTPSAAFKMFFVPCTSGIWWYVTAYILLCAIAPTLNNIFLRLNFRGEIFTLVILWCLFFIDGISNGMICHIEKAILYYLLGAFVRNSRISFNRIICLVMLYVSWGLFIVSFWGCAYDIKYLNIMYKMAPFIFVPLATVSILLYVCKIPEFKNKHINEISRHIYSVYLIHDSFYARQILWNGIIDIEYVYNMNLFPIIFIVLVVVIFLVCVGFDFYAEKMYILVNNRIMNYIERTFYEK
ncbi:MAG: acyltransferase family protein [Lachnospiraceae bacterium]|nr:acyltransferase family protein [Lachnospiraceae bacterium]